MAASSRHGNSFSSLKCLDFQQCRQMLFVVGVMLLAIQCVLGHMVNENLFMEILHPEDISYTYKLRPARSFGAVFNSALDSVYLVPTDPYDGCGELVNSAAMMNNVALVERGHCSFLSKAIVAERAGAIAVVIYDHDEKNDWSFIDMIDDGSERQAHIPAVFLLGRDGHNIIRSLDQHHLRGATINLPVNVTGIPIGHIKHAPWSLL